MSARGWVEADDRLTRSIEFKDFSEAFAFMTRVALIAERMGHHPTWTNTYNKVEIRLSTHDAGDVVTDKDRRMAKAIDALLEDQVGRLLLTQKKSAPPDHGGALECSFVAQTFCTLALMRRVVSLGSVLAITVTVLVCAFSCLPGLYSTSISPVPPGGMGALG